MQGAIVARWTGIVPSREAAAMQGMRDINAFYDKLVGEGRVTDYAWYFSANGGDGLFVARGEMDQLMAITQDPESIALVIRSELVSTGFIRGLYVTGDSVEPMANLFQQTVAQLG